jgi:hypothetical protein
VTDLSKYEEGKFSFQEQNGYKIFKRKKLKSEIILVSGFLKEHSTFFKSTLICCTYIPACLFPVSILDTNVTDIK